MRLLPAVDGENCFDENLSKTEGNRRIRPAFFTHYSQVFDTSREGGEGGSEAPTRQLARWGLLLIFHRTSRIKIQTILLVPVLRLLLHERYGPTYVLTIL